MPASMSSLELEPHEATHKSKKRRRAASARALRKAIAALETLTLSLHVDLATPAWIFLERPMVRRADPAMSRTYWQTHPDDTHRNLQDWPRLVIKPTLLHLPGSSQTVSSQRQAQGPL